MSMTAIAAVDENWGIGYKGDLLISLPEDQKGVFRKYTAGNTVVFGRKTLLTFPGERLLPKRVNIILTRNKDFEKEGAVMITDRERKNMRQFYRAVLALEDEEECRRFFDDVATIKEVLDLSARLEVARLLSEGEVFSVISRETGAGTET